MVAELEHPVKQEKITRPYGYTSNAHAEFMVVTPELAAEWLKNNQSNRPLSNRKVQLLLLRWCLFSTKDLHILSKPAKNVVDHYDILKFAEENEGFQAHVDKAVSLYKKSDRIFKASEIGGLMWLMKQKDKETAIRFWVTLTSGVGIEAGSIYQKLRNKFSLDRVASERMTNVARLAVIIKAWNAVTSGKNMTVFKHRKGDDFPTIK